MSWQIRDEDIIYNGDGFVVVNKPSGLPTQGTPDPRRDHLFAAVYRWQRDRIGQNAYVGLHHRLDKDTSGLVLFTTSRERNLWASQLFQKRLVQKHYLAIAIDGDPERPLEHELKNYLKKLKKGPNAQIMSPTHSGGDFAHTVFSQLDQKPFKRLIKASPQTGRMHQIRTHLQTLGFPIFGDYFYGGTAKEWSQLKIKFPQRLMLHASALEFPDPKTNNVVQVIAPLPEDMQSFWQLD